MVESTASVPWTFTHGSGAFHSDTSIRTRSIRGAAWFRARVENRPAVRTKTNPALRESRMHSRRSYVETQGNSRRPTTGAWVGGAFKVGRDSVAAKPSPATEWWATFKRTHYRRRQKLLDDDVHPDGNLVAEPGIVVVEPMGDVELFEPVVGGRDRKGIRAASDVPSAISVE